MRVRVVLLGLAAVSVTPAQSPVAMFAAQERDQVMGFWHAPSRYRVVPPSDIKDKGLWQVRLTAAGSKWLWDYNKARKLSAPPTADPKPLNDQQKQWEDWVVAKLQRDRWDAWQEARNANQEVLGGDLPAADKTIPAVEPPSAGPIPDGLFALVGDPPAFAEAVVPMEYDVQFDDLTLSFRDNVRVGSPRYAYYRFPQGTNSEGVPVKTLSDDKLRNLFSLAGVADSEARVMRAVSMLEGGFDAVNTYDTGFVSVGFIQFACLKEGAGSLGQMLQTYKMDQPVAYNTDFRRFGVDVTPDGKLDVLDPDSGAELNGPDAAAKVIDDKRLIAVFQRAGLQSDAFDAEQIKSAKQQFWPADDAITITTPKQVLTGKISDFVKSEAGLATLMDRKVNTGHLNGLQECLTELAAQENPATLADLAKYELEIVQAMKYRKDYLTDETLSKPPALPEGRSHNLTSRGNYVRGKQARKKKVDTQPGGS